MRWPRLPPLLWAGAFLVGWPGAGGAPPHTCAARPPASLPEDPNGYVVWCNCHGRFGNQVDQVLGAMRFCQQLDRTCVLAHFISYEWAPHHRVVLTPFQSLFRLEVARAFHRVLPVEDFMAEVAPRLWPPAERVMHCSSCNATAGRPMVDFWPAVGVHFIRHEEPRPPLPRVLAFPNPPGPFPVRPENRGLQRYLVWTPEVLRQAARVAPPEAFLGVHLRLGADWLAACAAANATQGPWMASPQCMADGRPVPPDVCFPSQSAMAAQAQALLARHRLRRVFVASDLPDGGGKEAALAPFLDALRPHADCTLSIGQPLQVDLAALGLATHFVGNCVSSFTAFVVRQRASSGLASSFWGRP